MKKALAILVVLVAAAVLVWQFGFKKQKEDEGPKQQPIAQSKYSESFNNAVQKVMTAYYQMADGFVNWDTTAVNTYSTALKTALDSVNMDEIKKDSLIYETAITYFENVKAELQGLILDEGLEDKRGALNILSQNMYDLLRVVKYDAAKVYLQECPMAFNDVNPGNWLSPTDAVKNPYLGTSHPRYGKSMLSCGGPKDTLNFMAVAETNPQ